MLRTNAPGPRFLEGLGGTRLEAPEASRGHGRFTEIAYGWCDLAVLAESCRPGAGPGRTLNAPQRIPAPTTPASTASVRRSVTAHSTPTPATGRTARSWRLIGSAPGRGPTRSVSWTATAPVLA